MYFVVEALSKCRTRIVVTRECIRATGKISPGKIYNCYFPITLQDKPSSGTFKTKPRDQEPAVGYHYEMCLISIEGIYQNFTL